MIIPPNILTELDSFEAYVAMLAREKERQNDSNVLRLVAVKNATRHALLLAIERELIKCKKS